MIIGEISVPLSTSSLNLPLEPGDKILVAGPNGSGKSALLVHLYRKFQPDTSVYLPGHRQIYFNSAWDAAGQGIQQLRDNLSRNTQNFNRIKNSWAEDQFKTIVRTLVNLENEYNLSLKELMASDVAAAKRKAGLNESPLSQLNSVFKAAGLEVRFLFTRIGLTASKGGTDYSIDAMSDGERAALFLSAAILVQTDYTVLFVDEPEKHLHPSIAWLLVEISCRFKPKIVCLFATHDTYLIERLSSNKLIYLKGSTVVNPEPEQRKFDAELIQNSEHLTEELKRDLIGSRANILFVEGSYSSDDIEIYRRIFPDLKVIPKQGARAVREATSSLRSLTSYHWLNVLGLIDGDAISQVEIEKLQEKGVLVSPFPTIENAFFVKEAMELFVKADLLYRQGESFEQRMSKLENEIPSILQNSKNEIVSRRTAWLLSRELEVSVVRVFGTNGILN